MPLANETEENRNTQAIEDVNSLGGKYLYYTHQYFYFLQAIVSPIHDGSLPATINLVQRLADGAPDASFI